MPAIRFFTILKTGRELAEIEKNAMLKELCYVASVALGDSEYVKKLADSYGAKLAPEEKPKGKVLNAASPETASFLKGYFKSVSRSVHG